MLTPPSTSRTIICTCKMPQCSQGLLCLLLSCLCYECGVVEVGDEEWGPECGPCAACANANSTLTSKPSFVPSLLFHHHGRVAYYICVPADRVSPLPAGNGELRRYTASMVYASCMKDRTISSSLSAVCRQITITRLIR
jgi:hypothetical protein